MIYQLAVPVADIHGVPETQAVRGKNETQLVFGETFFVTEEKDGWCKGACAHDGYVGYVGQQYLSKAPPPATHIVTACRSHGYKDPTMKSALMTLFSFGSQLRVTQTKDGFAQVEGGVWIYEKHLSPLGTTEADYLATARRFLETPYYWGGRSGFGIDCSGLVQVSLARAGITLPRDSGDQEKHLEKVTEKAEEGAIVFFPGHVGFMADDKNLLHANAFHMKVVIEPLADVVARGSAITSIRRP